MLVTLIVAPLDELSRVRLVLLDRGIRQQAHIVVHVEVEERPRLPSRLVHDEVIEGVVLSKLLVD